MSTALLLSDRLETDPGEFETQLEEVEAQVVPELVETANLLDEQLDHISGYDLGVFCYMPVFASETINEDSEFMTTGAFMDYEELLPRPVIFLASYVCKNLVEYQQSRQNNDTNIMTAFGAYNSVFIISHELGHARGIIDEGKTNCEAINLFPDTAEQLGVPELSSLVDIGVYVRGQKQPPEYHSAGC